MKNKQDILKLQPMIGRLTHMQWDEIHKAMDAYLNEYKTEQLALTDVSQHRELLIAFAKYMEEDKMYARHDEANVDDFLDNYSN